MQGSGKVLDCFATILQGFVALGEDKVHIRLIGHNILQNIQFVKRFLRHSSVKRSYDTIGITYGISAKSHQCPTLPEAAERTSGS